MGAILNGLSLSKIRPFGSGFLIFSDYGRAAIRLSALMEIPVIHIFTHDSIGVGEDGPTHQPVEHLASLRAIPGLVTLRPGDANEVVEAYRYIMQLHHQPAVLVLSRQAVPTLDRTKYAPASGVARGAYVLADSPGGNPEVILIASGSEVSLAVQAHEKLGAEGIRSRVVSMPSWEIFDHQSQEYRDSVLPPSVTARVAVEQGSTFGWERYVGRLRGPNHRHEDFRGFGSAQRASEEVRVRAGTGSGGCQGVAGQVVSNADLQPSNSILLTADHLRRPKFSSRRHVTDGGVNFSLFSRSATGVELLLFDREDDARPARVIPVDPSTSRTYHYWHVFVPGVATGADLRLSSCGPVRSSQWDALRPRQSPA